MAQAKLGFETTNDTSKAEKSFDRITAAAKRANAEIKRDGINVAEELSNKNRETFKAMAGRFAPVAAAVALLSAATRKISEAFAKMAENGKKLRETAEDVDLSAKTVARLKAQADAAGISAKEYAKSLDELKSGATSIDEISEAWARVAKEAHGAKEANAAFAEAMRKNFEDIAQSKNIEKLQNFASASWRWVASGLVDLVGADSNAETTIEYGLAKGIRDGRGKDAVIRRAIQSQTWSPVEGTVRWEARYKELEAIFDKRAAEIDSERQASSDKRITSVYDKLDGDIKLTLEALKRMGLGNLTEQEIRKAVERDRSREDKKTQEDRIVKGLMEERAKAKKAEEEAKREAERKQAEAKRQQEEAERKTQARDARIAAAYDKLGANAAITSDILTKAGMEGLTAEEVEAAVKRNLERNPQKKEEKLIKNLLDEQARREKEEQERLASEQKKADAISKATINYAYAQGGGLLAGINYGFLQGAKENVASDQLKQLTQQTASLAKMVDQLQQVNKTLAND